jgi:oligopeptide transport system permease protein
VRKFLFWRIVQFPLILAAIYLVTFLLVWVVPGNPLEGERTLSDEVLQQRMAAFHADSAWKFLTYYPWRILTAFDFGPSMKNQGFSVREIIGSGLQVSATIGFAALLIAVLVGVTIGTISAVRRDGVLDWAGVAVTLVGISVPSFVVASLLLLVFVAQLRWFTIGGYWLPSVALALAPMAYIVRLQRVSMLDTLGADYVRTARAKGLSKPRVVIGHCLRNAFLPVFTYLGPAAATTLTGSFVVERVFQLPGLGQRFVDAVLSRDQTMILGLVLVYSVLLLAFNLLVDIGYAFIDPRIDVTAKK